jgi:hypothetical protein
LDCRRIPGGVQQYLWLNVKCSLVKPLLASYNWHIGALWTDATTSQVVEDNWPDHHLTARGLVYQLGLENPYEMLKCHKNIRPVFLLGYLDLD